MIGYLVAVDLVKWHARICSNIQGSTFNHKYDQKTVNLGRMLSYLVNTVHGVNSWSFHEEREGLNFAFYHDGGIVDEKKIVVEDGHAMENKSKYGKLGVWLAWLRFEDHISENSLAGSVVVAAQLAIVNWHAHNILCSPTFSWWFAICSYLRHSDP
jgi:hypothetical protein